MYRVFRTWGALVCALACLLPTSASTEEMSLREVLALARDYAPLRMEEDARQETARWQQYRADRAFWPTLSAQILLAPVPANADPTRIDENFDEIRNLNLGPYFRQTLRLTMPVYTFGRISTAQELAQVGVDVAEYQSQAAILDHLLQTRRAYYGRQMSRAFQELIDEGDDLVKETLVQMEEDRAFGEADFQVEDLRRLQIFNAELDTMILDNRRLGDLTGAALRYLTNREEPIEVPAFDVEDANVELGALQDYLAAARTHRPEIQQLAGAVEARRLQEALAKKEFYPNFFLALDFGYGWSTKEPALQTICRRPEAGGSCEDSETLFARPYANPFDTLTVGLAIGMQWRVDFGQQYGRFRQSQAQAEQIEWQQERALGGLMLEIENLWRQASDARGRMEIEERRLEAARRWLNQYGLQQDLRGSEELSEVIDPLKAYYEARVAHLEAAHGYLVARAELARAVGLVELDDREEHAD